MTAPVEHAKAAVRDLLQAVGWLTASLLPGTHRPYRTPTLTAEVRAERDRQARLERLERIGVAPGETPAPLDLDIADLLSEILAAADRLADEACDSVGKDRLPPASSAFADPTPYLTLLSSLLPDIGLASPAFLRHVEATCDDLVQRAHSQLGLLGDGQLLAAFCPWCGGRDDTHPVGGARTLRIRAQLPPGANAAQARPQDVEWWVVCEGQRCDPPPADCGTWLRGRPAWSLRREAKWLADRLEHAAALEQQVAAIIRHGCPVLAGECSYRYGACEGCGAEEKTAS